jgi:hypothetical protein
MKCPGHDAAPDKSGLEQRKVPFMGRRFVAQRLYRRAANRNETHPDNLPESDAPTIGSGQQRKKRAVWQKQFWWWMTRPACAGWCRII